MDFCVIPAYNEEKTIKEVVTRIKKQGLIPIVVDDGSKDKTYEIAKKYAIVIRHEKNKGKGYALKTGISYALKKRAKRILLIDADLQHLPEEAHRLLNALNYADFVMGFRNFANVPFRHKLGNFVWRKTFNLFFGTKLKDSNNGYIAMSRKAAKIILPYLTGGYIIEIRMLIACLKNNLKITQVPVTVLYNRKKSKILRGIKIVFSVLAYIIREGLNYRIFK